MRTPVSTFLTLRSRRVHVRTWAGDTEDAPLLVLIHGWMDTSATFQGLADALGASWKIIAPDLRGFGQSEYSRENASGYWYPDYLADLDALLDHVSPDAPVRLIGHSLGGNIVCTYAGVRPDRVRAVISLDGFGVPNGKPEQAPTKITAWLDAVKSGERINSYASLEAVGARLQKNSPHLSAADARAYATNWTELRDDGKFHVLADPAHKFPFPTVYHLDETLAIWQNVTAPVLWLGAEESHIGQWLGYGRDAEDEMGENTRHSPEFQRRLDAFTDLTFALVPHAGHNLHQEQPAAVATLITQFFANTRPD